MLSEITAIRSYLPNTTVNKQCYSTTSSNKYTSNRLNFTASKLPQSDPGSVPPSSRVLGVLAAGRARVTHGEHGRPWVRAEGRSLSQALGRKVGTGYCKGGQSHRLVIGRSTGSAARWPRNTRGTESAVWTRFTWWRVWELSALDRVAGRDGEPNLTWESWQPCELPDETEDFL